MCDSGDGVAATDPASAYPGRVIASFAMLWGGRRAKGVPREWSTTLVECGRKVAGPSCHCPTGFSKPTIRIRHTSGT
jgi:hypothetical protein